MNEFYLSWIGIAIHFSLMLFGLVVGLIVFAIIVLFLLDITQTKDAIRKNYPVIGRFRTIFLKLGEFFRQYFFAMDREEMPFNRAERDWVKRATYDSDNTAAFGSTKDLSLPGTAIFVNCPFPTLDEDAVEMQPMEIGPYCRQPYIAKSFFNISAMSYGSLSTPAIRALSKGAYIAGCWLNTGEGGLSPYHLEGGCDLVMQIGTAKYGVRNENGNLDDDKLKEVAAYEQVRMFELKMSQGAKPGKGGILPGIKVTPEIAKIRGIPAGQDSISPNRHPEINNASEMLDMICHIRNITGKPAGFKAVIGGIGWLEQMCLEIHKRGVENAPDFITIDSGDGGTGASPMPLMDNVGLLVKESLPMVVDTMQKYGLRNRIKIIASGKLITPAEVAYAISAGADFVNSARGFMFSLGCIQAMRCNKNTCPTGVTTHKKHLQKGLNPEDKAVKVANYCKNIIHEVQMISHSCGVTRPRLLKRKHVRIVQDSGKTTPMDVLYPPVEILPEYCDLGNKPLTLD